MAVGTPGGLFVVCRAFKAHGKLYNVGDVIDDVTEIKLYRSRLADRNIVEFMVGRETENTNWLAYITARTQATLDSRIYALCGKTSPKVAVEEQDKDPVVAKNTVQSKSTKTTTKVKTTTSTSTATKARVNTTKAAE